MHCDRMERLRCYAAARARWPDVSLGLEEFRGHVARLRLDEAALAARADDVYIVAAVLAGTPNAPTRFEEYLAAAAKVARRVDRAPDFIDELKQELRVNLLTGGECKLRSYLATGPLLDWLRVVAVRLALNMKRRHPVRAAENLEQALFGDQEVQYLKRFYIDDMHGALEIGFGRLCARERTLLRLHFIDGLNIERLGVMYGVHRATVARWLVAIRRRLFDEIKAEFANKHGVDTGDVRSLYRLMKGDVYISVSRILGA